MAHGQSSTPDAWRRVQWVVHNPLDPDPGNRSVFNWDIVNITNGKIDSTWTDADFSSVEAELYKFRDAWRPYLATGYNIKERRYYRMQFNELSMAAPFVKSGAPERVFTDGTVGTGTQTLPAQVAISVTEKTPYPSHWGRFYLPQIASGALAAGGSIATLAVDALAVATSTAYAGLAAKEFYAVVPVTQIDKKPARGLLGVSQVQVDSLFDVIRSRRPGSASYRHVAP